MAETADPFPGCTNRLAYPRHQLPYRLRKLQSERNKAGVNELLEEAAWQLERTPEPPKPVTFADLEKLMRNAIDTFRGLEDAARQAIALKQQLADAQQTAADAVKAAATAKDAQTKAEQALADAQASNIPAADIQQANDLLDQLNPTPAVGPVPDSVPGADGAVSADTPIPNAAANG
jgi:hypothetical protein